MPGGRRLWLLMAMAIGVAGCRAGSTGSLSLFPRKNPSTNSFDLDEFVADHNRNAEAIQSLESRPTIDVSRRLWRVNVNGRMALERPSNFKLELEAQGVQKADIGSNAQEFWYWVANPDKDEKWIYWCNYRDLESSDLPVTYQPEWIIEAMGLKPITPREAAAVQVRVGPEAETTLLSFPATRDHGGPYLREMVVSNKDRRIKSLKIFSESPKMLIAAAQCDDYRAHSVGTTGSSTGDTCYLPQKLKLQWIREQLVLDVALGDVSVNQFDHSKGTDIFIEPDMPGYSRLNLAELSRSVRPDRRTRTRQTIPPPGSRDDIRLGRPAPMSEAEPVVPKVGRRKPETGAEHDDPPSGVLNELVGAPVSRPPSAGPEPFAFMPGSPGRDLSIER